MPRNEKLVALTAVVTRHVTAENRRRKDFGATSHNIRRGDTRTLNLHIDTTFAPAWNHKPWMPPSKHDGERNVAGNSNSTSRGFTIFNNREIQHESGIEHRVSTILQARRDLVNLRSQYPVIRYVDIEGIARRHTIDFFAELRGGIINAISVKPHRKKKSQQALMKQIATTGDYKDIDQFIVMTDEYATLGRFANARHILWSRDHQDGAELEKALALLSARQTIYFWELYQNGQHSWKRFAAVWQLIDLGILVPSVPHEHVTDLSRLIIKG